MQRVVFPAPLGAEMTKRMPCRRKILRGSAGAASGFIRCSGPVRGFCPTRSCWRGRAWLMARSLALAPSVLSSRAISCVRKSIVRPTGSVFSNSSREINWSRWLSRRVTSSVMSQRSAKRTTSRVEAVLVDAARSSPARCEAFGAAPDGSACAASGWRVADLAEANVRISSRRARRSLARWLTLTGTHGGRVRPRLGGGRLRSGARVVRGIDLVLRRDAGRRVRAGSVSMPISPARAEFASGARASPE